MYALVDCNNFYVSCERVFNPHLLHRPVAVLSNNDGCVVARSPEFKALNIPNGTPYFKLKPLEKLLGLVFVSSNYELYADMSHRVMNVLRELSPDLEQYSIDEAFVRIMLRDGHYYELGLELRQKIRQWVGLPVGIGIASTRTLAKIASHIAKKRTQENVFVMPSVPQERLALLSTIPMEDIWGVGHRFAQRLHLLGLDTARQLAEADSEWLRRRFNICLARTALELNGHDILQPDSLDEQPMKSIMYSKAFSVPITDIDHLREAFFTYAAAAAEKLRANHREAAGLSLFVQYSMPGMAFNDAAQFAGVNIVLPAPSANTSTFFDAISPAVPRLFRPNTRHRKCGVICFGLENSLCRQLELFSIAPPPALPDALYTAVDAINRQFGHNTISTIGEGLNKPWQMQRKQLSRRYTTNWNELLLVK